MSAGRAQGHDALTREPSGASWLCRIRSDRSRLRAIGRWMFTIAAPLAWLGQAGPPIRRLTDLGEEVPRRTPPGSHGGPAVRLGSGPIPSRSPPRRQFVDLRSPVSVRGLSGLRCAPLHYGSVGAGSWLSFSTPQRDGAECPSGVRQRFNNPEVRRRRPPLAGSLGAWASSELPGWRNSEAVR